jgi:hypothetical protein
MGSAGEEGEECCFNDSLPHRGLATDPVTQSLGILFHHVQTLWKFTHGTQRTTRVKSKQHKIINSAKWVS